MNMTKKDFALLAIVGSAILINEFGIASGLVFLTYPIALFGSLTLLLKLFPKK
jgi:hypothetical protein